MEDPRIVRGRQAPEKQMLARRMRREMTPGEWYLQVIDGFISDFYCHTARLIVEGDGDVHDDQAEYDAARVYRVSNARLSAEADTVLNEIRRIIDG